MQRLEAEIDDGVSREQKDLQSSGCVGCEASGRRKERAGRSVVMPSRSSNPALSGWTQVAFSWGRISLGAGNCEWL